MKQLMDRMEKLFTAIAFAEEGELEYARELMSGKHDEDFGHAELCKSA
jgi:hypothetical protein